MRTANTTLRAVRMGLLMSQDDFARAIRAAGARAGEPNDANKRLVQRWESGDIAAPRPLYARALEQVTGIPVASLGFGVALPNAQSSGDDHSGRDGEPAAAVVARPTSPAAVPSAKYSGVWLSRYEFFSSGRNDTFVGRHLVVVLQHGDRLTVRSLPGSADSSLTMDLTAEGSVVTGTWVEQTQEGYRGARYHGAIQLLAEPTSRRLRGKWVGFGKDMDVNTGPWELIFQDASTSRATLDAYNRPPSDD